MRHRRSSIAVPRRARIVVTCCPVRARATGLEPATTGSTVRYSNQLSYAPKFFVTNSLRQSMRLLPASVHLLFYGVVCRFRGLSLPRSVPCLGAPRLLLFSGPASVCPAARREEEDDRLQRHRLSRSAYPHRRPRKPESLRRTTSRRWHSGRERAGTCARCSSWRWRFGLVSTLLTLRDVRSRSSTSRVPWSPGTSVTRWRTLRGGFWSQGEKERVEVRA